jgi:hypothetical protein
VFDTIALVYLFGNQGTIRGLLVGYPIYGRFPTT